ncbi:MAG: glycosyltransferase family 4 protein [Candidatus Omnitrophica bacterium]|nr:glycosyltransferase family 4 protein [Candidatus Omnitrophota bacterium]
MREREAAVLMVIGAYDPEMSGGGVQCQELMRALTPSRAFLVLSVTTNASLPRRSTVDGIPVYRIVIDLKRVRSKLVAGLRLAWRFLRTCRRVRVVHLNGWSDKNVVLTLLAILFRKPILLTLHTAGYDEPPAVQARGRLAFWCYRRADALVGVSSHFEASYKAAGLPPQRFCVIPNGVDLDRFHPVDSPQRAALRRQLGLSMEAFLILFVGFFSYDKGPRTLFDAWRRLQRPGLPATNLVFVGTTRSSYFEIDRGLAQAIRDEAAAFGVQDRMVFVESSGAMERYYQAVDSFVLPSIREGLPMALLEAMASGLACVASRLPGSTDLLINDGIEGFLVEPGDVAQLSEAIERLIAHPAQRQAWGRQARERVAQDFSLQRMAQRYHAMYDRLRDAQCAREQRS